MYDGWRLGVEAGAWLYWQTWRESVYDLADNWDNISHRATPQVDFVVGARVDKGNFSISYRYYHAKASWNPYPGLATNAQVLMATYKF